MEVTDANEYDRRADKPWTKLTAKDKVHKKIFLVFYKSNYTKFQTGKY